MMKQFILISFFYLLYSTVDPVLSLKCRTGNQQSDDQFQKIIQVCRRRYLGYDRENGYNSRRSDSQESDSEEDMFDRKFLTSGSNRYNKNDNAGRYDYAGSSSSSRGTHQSGNRNWNSNRSFAPYNNASRSSYDSSNNQMNHNRRNVRNSNQEPRGSYSDNYSNRHNNNNNNRNYNDYNNNNDNNNNNNNNDNDEEHDQACIVQCFFNELNLVDQRGFPERSSVINVMIQNIQDPELRDFVEESIVECYHYLNNNGRQEKCQFSQNLLSCLAEKGSEKCEDWDDE